MKREGEEETGYVPREFEILKQSHSGATVIWDLFYVAVDEFEEASQELEEGEVIEPYWKPKAEVREMCLNGDIQEDRTAATLLQYLAEK